MATEGGGWYFPFSDSVWQWTTYDGTSPAPQPFGVSERLPSGLPTRRTKRIYGADVQARRDYR